MKIEENFILINCCKCGVSFALAEGAYDSLVSTKRLFTCINMHYQSFTQNQEDELRKQISDLKSRPPKVVEREIEVIVEKEFEPKNFAEMIQVHEHDFKLTGNKPCKICGVYKGAVELMSTPLLDKGK